MKLLAIDYGGKRVGVASTDDSGEFALPRVVLPNDANLLSEVIKLIYEGQIERVVVGESKNLDGKHNLIFAEIKKFVQALEDRGVDVALHPEVYTSMEADRLQGQNDMRDASAASLILKSYIDTQKKFMITIDEFKKGEITIGRILSAEVIEGSDKLIKLIVDFGEENPRTVVSGIRKYFADPSILVGVKCAFATNLEPRPLMGIPSEAMILAVSNDEHFSLLKVGDEIPPGMRVK